MEFDFLLIILANEHFKIKQMDKALIESVVGHLVAGYTITETDQFQSYFVKEPTSLSSSFMDL